VSFSCPEDMVQIPGLRSCVDRYEAARGDATSAAPGAGLAARSAAELLPWVGVTFEEAGAACASAGKRLCTRAEWTSACAGEPSRTFPYGDVYNGQMCATADHIPSFRKAQPTGSLVTCHGGVAGLRDFGGNVAEWIQGDADGAPAAKGASFSTGRTDAPCAAERALPGSTRDPALGFRCCQAVP
jgi:formylglycine-generating enzyme required for sulfatase activity